MAWKGTRFSIKRCCACDEEPPAECEIDSDTFDSDLSKWDEVSGTWNVAGGLLEGSGAGTLLLLAEPTLATDGVHLATNAETADGTAKLQLFAARSDADNYVFGELEISGGVGTIRVGKREGGVEEWLSEEVELRDDTELEDAHDLEFCWKPPQTQPSIEGLFSLQYPFVAENPDLTWVDEGNITADDDIPAINTFGTDGVSGALNAYDFRLAIPAGSTIDGVSAGIRARADLDTPGCGFFHTVTLHGDSFGTSDNKAASTGISDGGYAVQGFGGPTDTWGVVMTAEDLNDPAFHVQLKVEASGTATGGDISVDFIRIDVYYTTPDKTPGRVTLTYTNTEVGAAPETQCATGTTDWEPTGKGVGIRITAGDWDFTHFTASYLDSPTHTPCPTCDCGFISHECCADDDPASGTYIVDFGAGGWTDGDCDCDSISGEYALDYNGSFWTYSEEIDCSGDDATLLIMLTIENDPFRPGGCIWQVFVQIFRDGTHFAYNLYDFQQDPDVCTTDTPYTLPSIYENNVGALCGGALPGSVTVDVP